MYEKGDWYDQHIEDPLKGLVRYLRNNGINTECSCGHEMDIQCQFMLDGEVNSLHSLVYTYLCEHPDEFGFDGVNFSIELNHQVRDGCWGNSCLTVKLPTRENDRERLLSKKAQYERMRDYYTRQLEYLEDDLARIDNIAEQENFMTTDKPVEKEKP